MIPALLIAMSLAADEPQPNASGGELPTSFAMYVSLLEPVATAGGAVVTVAPLSAAVRLGAVLSGHHGLLIGFSFATQFDSPSGGTTLIFMPTYRYFLKALTAGGFSPYVQAELFVGYAFSSGGGGAGTSTVPFGFGGSFGAEYLVTRNFGLTGGAGLRFVHSESSFAGTVAAKANLIAMYVSAGLALHF